MGKSAYKEITGTDSEKIEISLCTDLALGCGPSSGNTDVLLPKDSRKVG